MPWDAIGAIAGVTAVALSIASVFVAVTSRWLRARIAARALMRLLSEQDFRRELIDTTLHNFVEPDTTNVDPAGREDYRAVFPYSEALFAILNKALYRTPPPQYLILLADSGMGKTSSLLAYCAHNLRPTLRRKYPIVLMYLGREGVEDRIRAIPDKRNKILFLDALDEDPRAIEDHRGRVAELMKEAADFRAVLLSCRSQFFHRDEEITHDTGIAIIGPRPAGDSGEYQFKKIYLVPFDDAKVRLFLRRRYGIFRLRARRQAEVVLNRIGDLSARPMLLAYVDDLELKRTGGDISLREAYQQLVSAWLVREKRFVSDTGALLNFCTRLAVEIYLRRRDRGGEFIPIAEIRPLADEWGIAIEGWKLHGRSLLNRDYAGNYKFAHRSIMEFLFVEAFFSGSNECVTDEWTDQMQAFAAEYEAGIESQQPALAAQYLRVVIAGRLPLRVEPFVGALRRYSRGFDVQAVKLSDDETSYSLQLTKNKLIVTADRLTLTIYTPQPENRDAVLRQFRALLPDMEASAKVLPA